MVDGGQRGERTAARLRALEDAAILDTPREERFDRLARIAALTLDVPMAFVSYLDDRRQWFKAAIGIDEPEVPIEATVCQHVLAAERPIVVADASADPVLGPQARPADVRFYAGFPIADAAGNVLGTFCVADRRVRELSAAQRAVLEELAALAVEETFSLDRAEAARRVVAGERWFERVTEAAIDGLVIAGEDGHVVHVNRAAEAMFGWRREELVGRSVRTLLAREHDGYFDEAVAGLRRTGTADGVLGVRVYSGLRRDGTVFPMEVSTSVPDGEGSALFIFSVRDVSDRVAAYGELERSEARFRILSETAPVGIVQATSNLRCVYVNRAWSAMTGIPELEAIAQPWTAGIHPDDVAAFERAWAAAQEADRELAMEFRMLARDGRVTFVVGHAITVVGPDGEVEGRLLTVQDVSVLRETRTTLAEAEDLHQRVVDSMTDGVVVTDRSGRILTANGASATILGIAVDELVRMPVGSRWRALRPDGTEVPPSQRPPVVALTTGRPCLGVLMGAQRPDGVVRWLRVNSMPLVRPDEDEPWGVATTFADVTESLALARMKDEFVSTVSHELRTPLTSIRGALGLLVSTVQGLEPPARRMLEIAESNTRRLVRLIDDILDIERMESGRAPLAAQEVDLGDLVQQAVETMAAMATDAGVELRTSAPSTVAWVDPDRIAQVLTNLLSNAIKFSPAGGTVRVTLTVDDTLATVRVADEGRGVPLDRQLSIFERFEQVDKSDARERGGTGLGLAICKSIVQQHGGTIGVDSEPGRGSTFWFSVPLLGAGRGAGDGVGDGAGDVQGAPAAGDDTAVAAVAAPPRRVLVVEDDGDLASVLVDLLGERSVVAVAVPTLEDARAALADGGAARFDLVLLDLLLPDGDGLELVEEVRRSSAATPVVAYSALDPASRDDVDVTEYHVKGRTDPARFADRIAALAGGEPNREEP